jgi:hypothetical protein
MKSVRLIPPAVFALLIGQTATADVVRHAAIPASLWGTWALNLDDCNNADNVMVLSAKGRDSSEVKCTVDWVSETPGARGSIFSARLHCRRTANGSDNTIANVILVPTDANQVSVGPDFSSLKSYQRCAANTPPIFR